MAINRYEEAQNLEQIELLSTLIITIPEREYKSAKKPENLDEKLTAALTIMLEYAKANDITLLNLTSDEFQRTKKMLFDHIDSADSAEQFRQKLPAWKDSLQQAQAGKGNEVHKSRSSGMAEDLRRYGVVPATKWGTDLDAMQALGENLTTFASGSTITQAGVYILSPVSLTEASSVAVETRLAEAKKAVEDHNVTGKVELQIPVNCHDSHWKLVQVTLDSKQEVSKPTPTVTVTRANLWDSMGGAVSLEDSTYRNLAAAVKKLQPTLPDTSITSEKAGKQTNGYSCLDYVVQEALVKKQVVSPITQAQDAGQLRLALVKTIAQNSGSPHAAQLIDTSSAAHDVTNPKFAESKKPATATETEETKIRKTQDALHMRLKQETNKDERMLFDSIFAKKLQDKFNRLEKTCDKDQERSSEADAFEESYKEQYLKP